MPRQMIEAARSTWNKMMRVLVVEDEVKMAALLKQGLEEQNHSVEVAHDGRAALAMAGDL